jgi:hypothetical protein
MKSLILFLTTSMLCLHMGAAVADAYKCVEKGKITISSEPCPDGATHAEIIRDPMPDAEVLAAARADLDRLRQSAAAMTRERHERDAAYAAQQKSRAEQAALEAQAQRDAAIAATAAAAAAEPQRSVVYGWPVYEQDMWRRRDRRFRYGHSGARHPAAVKRQNTQGGFKTESNKPKTRIRQGR